jgi:hypothetical protein
MKKLFFMVSLCLLYSACDDGLDAPPNPSPAPTFRAGCQPLLGGQDCLLPYPSDFFSKPDNTTQTGVRLEIPDASRLNSLGKLVDPRLTESDGASLSPTILALLPDNVSTDGFVGLFDDPTKSLTATSQTIIINTETNEAVPHFVDLDPRTSDPLRRAIVLHPLVALAPKTRYVVGLHNAKRADGTLAKSATGFALLRDGQTSVDSFLEAIAPHFEAEVFPVLEAFGIPKAELQLAWDFTTGSKEAPVKDMLRVRELTLAALAQEEPTVDNITIEETPGDSLTCKIVRGSITGPLFLTTDDNKARLLRDANGEVLLNKAESTSFTFTAIVPNSVCNDTQPGRVVAFGHGFFGSQGEAEGGSVRTIAERLKAVVFAIDWQGMSLDDGLVLVEFLTSDLSKTMTFTDSVQQGMVNWIATTKAIKSRLLQDPAFQRTNGDPLYQTTPVNFLGISQGHILGAIMSAINPDIERATLNVGGAGITLMMFRAPPFNTFLTFLESSLDDALEQQKFAALIQESFDRADPASFARFLLAEPLPQSPPDRRILFQTGLGDSSVPNVGSFYHMRLLGLSQITPSPTPIFGVPEVDGPIDDSGIAVYDFGFNVETQYGIADPALIPANEVHETVRQLEAVHQQMDAFFKPDGKIINFCNDICNPE